MSAFDANAYTAPFQLTKTLHREVYPEIDPSSPHLKASGKVILITGAGGQIGGDIAIGWATAGAKGIILVGRNEEPLKGTANAIKNINDEVDILVFPADMTLESDIEQLYKSVRKKFEKVHVLVNCAGSAYRGNIVEIDVAKWWTNFETNVKGPFLMSRYFINTFGADNTIINISTIAAGTFFPGASSYSVSKLAALKITEFLEAENPNLRVFSLAPGIVKSKLLWPHMTGYAIDDGMMSAGWTLYFSLPEADYLKGGFCNVNWDIKEMELHKDEIIEKRLVKNAFINAQLGPEGYSWEK